MKTNWTPGPWKANPTSGVVGSLITAEKNPWPNVAAAMPRSDKQETEANSFIIAASPDMYEALKLAKAELHEMQLAHRHGNRPRNPELTDAAFEAVSAAMKKAESSK
jgi:hypothetical protein